MSTIRRWFPGLVGWLVGFPSLRLKGLYLAMATLAAHFIARFKPFDNLNIGIVTCANRHFTLACFTITQQFDFITIIANRIA